MKGSILTSFGIALGAAAIVFLASVLDGASVAVQRLGQSASGADVTRIEGLEAPGDARWTRDIDERDGRALAIYEQAGDDDVSTSRERLGQWASAGSQRGAVGVQGGGATLARLSGLTLLHGRWLTPPDDGTRTCMVGHDVWRELLGGVWPPTHARITLNDATELAVVGVLSPRPRMGGGGGDTTWAYDRKVWVSSATFTRTFEARGRATIVLRHPSARTDAPDVRATALRLLPLLASRHRGVRNFEFAALNDDSQLGHLIVMALAAVLLGCGVVVMFVGAVNVANAQLVTVHLRVREYGIRRAVGLSARRLGRDVLLDTLRQTLIATAIGSLVGLVLAAALARGLDVLTGGWPFHIVWSALAAAGVGGVVAGVAAGCLPAHRASSLAVMECLRG